MKQGTDYRLYSTVDFRPEWYLTEERHRRVSRCYRMSASLLFVVMVGLVGGTWSRSIELSRYHQAQATQVDGVNTKMTQVQQLQHDQVALRAQVKVLEALHQPLEYNQVLRVFASFLPESVALRDLGMAQRTIRKTRPMSDQELKAIQKLKTRRALNLKTVTSEQEVLELEVKAVASSHVVIANLIGELASSQLFEDVKMLRSEPIELDQLQAHLFSLRMVIPLDRNYDLSTPESEVGQDDRAAQESAAGVDGMKGGLGHVE